MDDAQRPLTAEMIADLSAPQDLQLSPDGSQVAYALARFSSTDEHPTGAIWLAPTDGSAAPRPFTSGATHDHSPRWSPDGSRLAFLSDRATRGTAQLYSIPADGGEARALTPVDNTRPVEEFAWSPGGGHIAFTSADEPSEDDERREKERDDAEVYGERWPYARLRLVSLASARVDVLMRVDRHVAEFAWSPDGTELAALLWQAPTLEYSGRARTLVRVSVAGGEPRTVCGLPAGGAWGPVWSSDGATLFYLGAASPHSQSSTAVYAVAADGGEPAQLALGEESCAEELLLPPGAPRPAVAVAKGLGTTLHWLDPDRGSLTPIRPEGLDDTSGLGDWHLCEPNGGGTALAVVRSAGNTPWEVWAGRAEDGAPELQQLTHHQTALHGLDFGPQQPFTWRAPDGLELDGLLIRPPNAAEEPLPTVVLVHGGPYGRWGQGFQLSWGNWGQWLATAGFAVLMPNPRGGFGHGEAFAAAARGAVGKEDFGDVMAMVDAAVERGVADPERLGIGGWSQGGFMTAWAVTQTERFRAAVMGAGVSDWGMMTLTSDVPDFERELGGSVPWDGVGPLRHAELSPITFARRARTPILLLHGRNDERVPVSQAIGFHRALRDAEVPTELVIYPREPHGVRERRHQIDLLTRVRGWYDRWLRT